MKTTFTRVLLASIAFCSCLWPTASSSSGGESRQKKKQRERNELRMVFKEIFELEDLLHAQDSPKQNSKDTSNSELSQNKLLKASRHLDQLAEHLDQELQTSLKSELTQVNRVFIDRDLKFKDRITTFYHFKAKMVELFSLDVSPATPPDLALGKSLFATQCSSCHGNRGRGDGELSQKLPTSPKDMSTSAFYRKNSPLRIFNWLLVGNESQGMPSFSEHLNPHELWSLSFYLLSLASVDSDLGADLRFDGTPVRLEKELNYQILATANYFDLVHMLGSETIDNAQSFENVHMTISQLRSSPKVLDTLKRKSN